MSSSQHKNGALSLFVAVVVMIGAGSHGAAQDPLTVDILEPARGETVFGPFTIRCSVYPEWNLDRVTFFVDGKQVGEATTPPWQITADAGDENRRHEIRVVAHDRSGRSVSVERVLPSLHIEEQVELDLQQVYVTVNRGVIRELGLTESDFRLTDDGRVQNIVTFASGEIPFTAVVLADASDSMEGAPLAQVLEGARAFVNAMNPLDEAQVFAVSDRLIEVTDVGTRGQALVEVLDGIESAGGTALFDSLYLALETVELRQGRRVVIVLSDGVDGLSSLSMNDILEVTRESRAQLYWIRPQSESAPHLSAWRTQQAARKDLARLERAVRESGGRIVPISGTAQARAAMLEVLLELREQYALGYYPSPDHNDGRWRAIDVRVNDPLLTVRWRRRYRDW